MTDANNGLFDWGKSLTQEQWRELGASVGASELQIKFAVCKFHGANNSASARMAGYQGNDAQMRTAGYAAVRSTAVQNLLELAALHSPESAKINPKEIDAKLAKMIRSPDSNVSLKAMELYRKYEDAKSELEREQAANRPADPQATLNEIAAQDPIMAAQLAVEYGLKPPDGVNLVDALRKHHCPTCAMRLAKKLGVNLESLNGRQPA